jgi:hypothetical protein
VFSPRQLFNLNENLYEQKLINNTKTINANVNYLPTPPSPTKVSFKNDAICAVIVIVFLTKLYSFV